METEIIQKLSSLLSAPIEREAEVVYVLVEIRKLLDHEDRRKGFKGSRAFPVLRMYCDWVVHISLDRYRKGSILESVDAALLAGPKKQFDAAFKEAFFIFSFDRFRSELATFLQQRSLPTVFVDALRPAPWGRFLKLYLSVISECPLIFVSSVFKCLKSATLVVLEVPDTFQSPGWHNISWQWKFELKDGTSRRRSCTSGYSTEENATPQ